MQLPLPLLRQRGGATVIPLRSGASTIALQLVRNRRARRYVLRVSDGGNVIVTMPRWGSIADARAFAEQHVSWIARERLRRAAESTARAWTAGSEIWLRGERHAIAVSDNVVRAGGIAARCTDAAAVGETLRRALREQAKRELPPRLLELAARAGLRVHRISVRDQRSRWGSCSTRGAIALNWRLLLMPPAVRDYVLWHELMHLRRADHSPAFWKLVEQVCPDYRAAKSWLAKYGKELA
jgi:predicted metal-dependent hydrolase